MEAVTSDSSVYTALDAQQDVSTNGESLGHGVAPQVTPRNQHTTAGEHTQTREWIQPEAVQTNSSPAPHTGELVGPPSDGPSFSLTGSQLEAPSLGQTPDERSGTPHRHFHFIPIPRSQDGESDSSGTILITVNYVFSDNNNPQNPNRLGSLVMTFPDNASNRQPRIMQELVRFATLMAYRTIVSGLHKNVGTTLEKFNSFPTKHQSEGSVCAICFEEYESDTNDAEETPRERCKRRRLNSPDPLTGDDVNYQPSPTLEAPLLPESPLPPVESTGPKYLSEDSTVYPHLPAELPCGHVFGRSCLNEWLKTNISCPLCRQKVEEVTPLAVPPNVANGLTPIVFLNGSRGLDSSLDALAPDNALGREGGVLSNILSYLRGPRESINPQGVSSRRTESGVETVNDAADYMNLGHLAGRAGEVNANTANGENGENGENGDNLDRRVDDSEGPGGDDAH